MAQTHCKESGPLHHELSPQSGPITVSHKSCKARQQTSYIQGSYVITPSNTFTRLVNLWYNYPNVLLRSLGLGLWRATFALHSFLRISHGFLCRPLHQCRPTRSGLGSHQQQNVLEACFHLERTNGEFPVRHRSVLCQCMDKSVMVIGENSCGR